MANYVLPQFNLQVGIWRHGSSHAAPPDVSSLGNLSPGRTMGLPNDAPPPSGSQTGTMWLRLPALTDIRDGTAAAGADTVECPLTSGRFYNVTWVDDIGAGFANEHRFAILSKIAPWPTPFPGGGGLPPIAPMVVQDGPTSTGVGSFTTLTLPPHPIVTPTDNLVGVFWLVNPSTAGGVATVTYPGMTAGVFPGATCNHLGTLVEMWWFVATGSGGVVHPLITAAFPCACILAESWWIHYANNCVFESQFNQGYSGSGIGQAAGIAMTTGIYDTVVETGCELNMTGQHYFSVPSGGTIAANLTETVGGNTVTVSALVVLVPNPAHAGGQDVPATCDGFTSIAIAFKGY